MSAAKPKRLAILTSGGDAPGMNAAIRAATVVAAAHGVDMIGIRDGYRGLLADDMDVLTPAAVAGILRDGGTMLGSARCLEFHEIDARNRARQILAARGVAGLIVVGGNGSLTGALHLSDAGEANDPVPVLGIPASIDNDLALTGFAIGVDTAMNTIVEACDKIADTATAHKRTFIVEVMGRDCGYLAMTAAVASGADGVLFPERHRSESEIVDSIVNTVLTARKRAGGSKRVIIIKAEGVAIPIDRLKAEVDERLRAAGGEQCKEVETRITVLGHVVRGGRPSAFDRLLGSRLANVAVRALLAGDSRKMAAWMPPVDTPPEVGQRAACDPYCWLVDLPAVLAETEKLLSGASPLARWRSQVFDDVEDALLL